MPVIFSVKKTLRKSIKNRRANLAWKNKLEVAVKEHRKKPSKETLAKVYSIIDKMAKRNILAKNKVARLKAKYSRK